MLAFHSNPTLKAFVLAQLAEHREADKLIKGKYWENGKGCAVGCTLEAVRLYNGKFKTGIDYASHALYESELGIPRILARLEDRIFEKLPNGDSQAWPERFTNAIRPGADLTMVWPQLAYWLLTDEVPPHTKNSRSLASLAEVGALYREWIDGTKPTKERWLNARDAASAASADADADSADAAADAAADASAAAAAAAAASAASADADAAADASASASASADAASASADAYRRQSDKLIELLEAA
jgi:hypothetical protein